MTLLESVSDARALAALGWSEFFQSQLERSAEPAAHRPDPDDTFVARVAVVHVDRFELLGPRGPSVGVASGLLQRESASPLARPAVGDWVVARGGSPSVITRLLERRTCFLRKAAGRRVEPQVVVANVDRALLVAALGADFNERRLERYLVATRQSGALPIVVLNKADRCPDPAPFVARATAVAPGAPVRVVSAVRGDGIDDLAALLSPGTTVALLGSSGVGKSALLNRLAGGDVQSTGEIRAHDERGKHTTTHRQLFRLPSGALVVDTPGMRELEPWGGDVGVAGFDDIDALAERCRFRDCRHEEEPGCAVRGALDDGSLDAARLAAHDKLQRELAWQQRRRREGPFGGGNAPGAVDRQARAEEKRFWREVARRSRASPKR